MYLSLNSVLIGGRVGWPDFARLAAKVGYPGVDVELGAAMKAGLAPTNALLEELHLKPAAVNLPVEFRKDDDTFRHGLERLADQSSFSAAIGCPRMVTYIMSSSKTPKAELRALYLKRFRACADVLARSHVRLGLEFLGPLHLRQAEPYEFIWRMPEMLAFARECGPNVGLLLDVWHWYHAGATTDDIIKAGKDGIVHVHFNDSPNLPPDQIRDDHRLMPGEGVINLVGFLRALQEIGYQDALSVEVFGRTKDMTSEEAARMGLETSRAVMRKAGVA
ncbi:MAG: sugar phosphate isomerase/epimerase family protein [Bryobacteraceae bacterium]